MSVNTTIERNRLTYLVQNLNNVVYPLRRYANLKRYFLEREFRVLRAEYYDSLWLEAARAIGAELQDFGHGYRQISTGGYATIVHQDKVMLDNHLFLKIMGHKAITYKLLGLKNCPIPKHAIFSTHKQDIARSFLKNSTLPVVVKPLYGTGGGRGVTTGIINKTSLKKAIAYAGRYASDLLIEEQLSGHSYRLLYLNGEFIDAIRREPPIIVGDGKSTIRQLITKENKSRLENKPVTALSPLIIDVESKNYLSQNGLNPGSRPAEGKTVIVKKVVNENNSQQNFTVRSDVHPDTVELGAKLARDLGGKLLGIDIMSPDISVALENNYGKINEINTTPGLHHHGLINNADESINTASLILKYMFESGEGLIKL